KTMNGIIFLIESEAINLYAKLIQNKIEDTNYRDARALEINTCLIGDDATIPCDTTDNIVMPSSTACSQFSFVTSGEDRLQPLRDLTKSQIPYFIQDIKISKHKINDEKNLLKCHILMPPLRVEIVCTNIFIDKDG